ncbi:MAG: recombinase family protein [Planctomycetota bacterium]
MSDKIQSQHLTRKAILYVRQSSSFQVQHNEESRRLQYAMQQRLELLGWQAVEVIDEDLGRSAAGSTTRSGFEKMVSDVCLGNIGAVAAREVSRFARNSRDWQQLVEVCRVVDTLLIDHETVYSPRQSNDRLLLGLKGSLNEYELDLLRQRSLEARYQKAKRGELIVAVPVGFLKTGSKRTHDQRIEKDPDLRVQEAIALIFKKCFELGSLRQALMWLLEQGLKVPARDRQGELSWKRPVYSQLHQLVTNPVYAGAYVYGRTEHKPCYQDGVSKTKSRRKKREQWHSLIPDHHDGYISWQDYQRLQEMLSNNSLTKGMGAPRNGSALLAGLLNCRQCSRKLIVYYTGTRHDVPRYCCHRGHLDNGEEKCISFGGLPVDRAVSNELFRVIQPAALEAAVLAHQQQSERQHEVLQALQRQLEQAHYEATRAQRQYDATDPENRLVTEELEKRWNAALENVVDVESRIALHQQQAVQQETGSLEDFTNLAADVEALWNAPDCDARIKKRIVRTLIENIVADIDHEAFEVILTIHWVGGVHTELRVPRRRRGKATATSTEAIDAVRSLARICSDDMIAGYLNRNGMRTGRGNRFTRERVVSLRTYQKIPCFSKDAKASQGWMNLTEAAKFLGISNRTLRMAIERGDIAGEHPLSDGPWIIKQSDLETAKAKAIAQKAKQRSFTPAVPDPDQQTLDF